MGVQQRLAEQRTANAARELAELKPDFHARSADALKKPPFQLKENSSELVSPAPFTFSTEARASEREKWEEVRAENEQKKKEEEKIREAKELREYRKTLEFHAREIGM